MSLLWKWTRRVAIGTALLLVLLLLVVGFMNWRASRKVAARIAALGAAGQPVAFSDLVPPPGDPADNAATYLQQAAAGSRAIQKECLPLSQDRERFFDSEQLNDEGADRVREALAAHPDVVPLLVKASDCSSYVSTVDMTGDFSSVVESAMSDTTRIREAARVLVFHVDLLNHDGQADTAVDSCLAILRLARLGDAEPFLIGNLVTTAVRGIGCGKIAETLQAGAISNASGQKIEEELARQDAMPGCLRALQSERVLFIYGFQHNVPRLARYSPSFVNDQLTGIEVFDAYMQIAGQPRYQVIQQLAAIEEMMASAGVLTQLLAPALTVARDAVDRSRANLRCTRVLVSLDAFLRASPAATPTLEQLAVPADAKTDPYTGDPLVLKQIGNGWIVYSLGADLIDQGGSIDDQKDVGVGPLLVK